jgi:hypothetical protein
MIIQIQIRSVFGEDKAYPANEAAKGIANIANTKTLPRWVLLNVLAMGCDVQELDRYGNVSRTIKGGPDRKYGDMPRIA